MDSWGPVENIFWVEKTLSKPRLAPYLKAMNGDLDGALSLYVINVLASAELFEWLAFLEICLRNSLVTALRGVSANEYDDPFLVHWKALTSESRDAYSKATKRLTDKEKNASFDRIISELPFGFWRYLLSATYESTLWTSHLRHAFPGLRPRKRALVYAPLENLVYLRNRIAHHEPIFNRHLGQDLAQIQQIIGWISPEALAWAKANLPTELVGVRNSDP